MKDESDTLASRGHNSRCLDESSSESESTDEPSKKRRRPSPVIVHERSPIPSKTIKGDRRKPPPPPHRHLHPPH